MLSDHIQIGAPFYEHTDFLSLGGDFDVDWVAMDSEAPVGAAAVLAAALAHRPGKFIATSAISRNYKAVCLRLSGLHAQAFSASVLTPIAETTRHTVYSLWLKQSKRGRRMLHL